MRKIAVVALLLAAAGCGKSPPPGLHPLSIKGHVIYVEKCVTPAERARGLMYRRELPENRGMLFVYYREQVLSFWMKNTYIPLSVAFIDSRGVIVDIQQMEPLTTDSHRSPKPVLYALEANRSWFARRGIGPGDRVEGLACTGPGGKE